MKIFAAGLATETNTFSSIPTALGDFIVRRSAVATNAGESHPGLDLNGVWGRQAHAASYEFCASLNAWAQPSGTTTRTAYECLRDEILRDLRAAMPVDIVLLMLHGAMVAEGYEDCERDMIERVRDIVGADVVVGVELDLHCHLTEAKLACADLVVMFKEYPHVDIEKRARELFELAIAARRGKIRPTMALFDCRMVGMYPTSRAPLRGFVDSMMEAEGRDGVLSVSFAHGFPFADIAHLGAKLLVVADDDQRLAEDVAREFGLKVYALRKQIGFDSLSLPLEAALSRAVASKHTPVVVADQSDNTGGGAPGDATFALRWLLEHGVENAATALIYDPEVVRIATRAGPNARLAVRLGGKLGPTSGDPLDLQVVVHAIREDYLHAFVQESGQAFSPAGDVVALRCGSIDIVASSQRCQCFSPSIFSDLGIDPTRKRLLIPKSTQHFFGAFADIAGEVIYMAGPGAVPPDPQQIPYRHLDTARLYPWNDNPLQL